MTKKTQSTQEPVVLTVGEDETFTSLRAALAEINNQTDITGYILRNATTAVIDLKRPAQLTEHALLASQTLESAQEISALFNLGTVTSILVTGKTAKTLCITIDENNIAIFMEQNTDHNKILKRLQQTSS
jgi:predicted regulator of Ras-like GTPase activity (Roadblock/LC7/MglB family)